MTRRRTAGASHGCAGPVWTWAAQLRQLDPDRWALLPPDITDENAYRADRTNWPDPTATEWASAIEQARASRRRQFAVVGFLAELGRLTDHELEQLAAVDLVDLERLDADDAGELLALLNPPTNERHQ
jgi:hypothetical protein